MSGKQALAHPGGPRRGTPRSGTLYENGNAETKMTTRGGISDVALIRGTMLELVRRDGRDLTARQLTTLLTVYLHNEVHSVSSLARMLNISRPGVTRILDRLVEADLVSRAEDAADRRRVLVYRTPSGAQYIRDFDEVAGQVAKELGSDSSRLS
jgi:DNA-binding MarR family transcriptional regulator